MNTILIVNLSDHTAAVNGSAWSPPTFTFGESLIIGLNLQETVNGSAIASDMNVTGLTASIGPLDARPGSGEWALQFGAGPATGANTTAALQYNASPQEVQAAINALAAVTAMYGTGTVRKVDGSYLITFSGTVQPIALVVNNTLRPISYGHISTVQYEGVWTVEVRLTQLTVAFTDSSARILTPAPVVEEITQGGTSGDATWNEVQSLYVRPDYGAAFALRVGSIGQTANLTVADTPATIQNALVAQYGSNFTVTLGTAFTAYIEFTGIYAGAPQPLITVLPIDPPLGALTFTLVLDRYELQSRLRAASPVTLPLEVVLTYLDEDGVSREEIPLRQNITIQAPLAWPDMALVPMVDWLRPPSPTSYVPFDPTSVITGQQFFSAAIGDGEHTAFTVADGLATDIVFAWVRENNSPGRQLVLGVDYTIQIDDLNSVTVTALLIVPALNAWLVTVMSAQTVAAFANGLMIDITQVNGLEARLEAIEASLAALNALVPSGAIVATAAGGNQQTLVIPPMYLIFPSKRLGAAYSAGGLDGAAPNSTTVLALPRPPAFFPAVNTATVTAFDDGALPASPGVGTVWQNTGSTSIFIPAALGLASAQLAPAVSGAGGYAGWDGRAWYLLTRGSASSTSFFPAAFEQVLMSPMFFDASLWQPGQAFTLNFTLSVQTFRATSNIQWDLVIDIGTAPSDVSPATTSPNLEDVVWSSTPLMTERLIATPLEQTWPFGCQISRANDNTMKALKLLATTWVNADAAPDAPSFMLRVRLVNFDTQDPAVNATGYVWAHFATPTANIQ